MSIRKTCSVCRSRKIRCDGGLPKCRPCSNARTAVCCDYNVATRAPCHSELLRKGSACRPCRRKKKKCNGERPFCRTCGIARKEDQCEYDDDIFPSVTLALLQRTQELEQRLRLYESFPAGGVDIGRTDEWNLQAYTPTSSYPGSNSPTDSSFGLTSSPITASSVAFLDLPSPLIPADIITDIPLSPDVGAATASPYVLSDELDNLFHSSYTMACDNAVPNGSIFVDSALSLESPLHIDTAQLRSVFLGHCLQLGFSTTSVKMDALIRGDTSCTMVHPVIVHIAHLWGIVLCGKSHVPVNLEAEIMHFRLVFEAMDRMPPNVVTLLQIYNLMGLYFFFKRDISRGRDFLVKASTVVLQHNLHIRCPAAAGFHSEDSPLVVATELDEEMNALCQLLYLDKASNLLLDLPLILDHPLDNDFRMVVERHSQLGLTSMRTNSVSLLHETRLCASQWSAWGPMQIPGYWTLLQRIQQHLSEVTSTTLRATLLPDAHATELTLKLCATLSLTALAELHNILAATHTESYRKCLQAAMEIVSLAATFSESDFDYLDPVLSTCWQSAERYLDREQRSLASSSITTSVAVISAENVTNMIVILRQCTRNLRRALPYVA